MGRRNAFAILLLSVSACAAQPAAPPRPVALSLSPSVSAPELRARIGPVFADEGRSQIPTVGTGPTDRQSTGIAEGAVALLRDDGQRQEVVVYDAHTAEEIPGDRPAFFGPGAPKVSADGQRLAYTTQTGARHELVMWDLARDERVSWPALADTDVREVDLSGDGSRLLYVKGVEFGTALCVYDGEERVLPLQHSQAAALRSPTISADGKTAAYVAASPRGDANIYVVDLATGRPIAPPTLNTVDAERDPALNADGSVLLFSSDRNGSFDLYAYSLRQGQYLDMGPLNSLGNETMPRFLGLEDEGVAYVSDRDGHPAAYMHAFRGWQ